MPKKGGASGLAGHDSRDTSIGGVVDLPFLGGNKPDAGVASCRLWRDSTRQQTVLRVASAVAGRGRTALPRRRGGRGGCFICFGTAADPAALLKSCLSPKLVGLAAYGSFQQRPGGCYTDDESNHPSHLSPLVQCFFQTAAAASMT